MAGNKRSTKYKERMEESRLLSVPSGHREDYRSDQWLARKFGDFFFFHSTFYEDQLVRYINDRAARIIRPGFLRAGPFSADGFFRKIDCVSASRRNARKRENTIEVDTEFGRWLK